MELLCVIAVIAVLAAMTIAAVSSVRQRARAVQCQSNLRQVGLAIIAHASEHRRLPGPLYGKVFPAVMKNNTRGRLAGYLAPRFDTTTISNEVVMVPVMVCPGFAAERPELIGVADSQEAIVYVNNTRTDIVPGHAGTVWGNPDGAAPYDLPVMLNDIPRPASTWMLSDMDSQLAVAWGYRGWPEDKMAPRPVHGSIRNRVYFDGHVTAVPLNAPASL